ncbi:MAG TPA: HAMP domain-containing protein, partial [Chloroflexota bacterium]
MSSSENTSESLGVGPAAGPPQPPQLPIPGETPDQAVPLILGGPAGPPPETTDGIDSALLLRTLIAVKRGDFSARMPEDWTGTGGKIADTLNDVIDLNARLVQELQRISRLVGKEGKTTQRATLGDVGGSWAGYVYSLNSLVDDLVRPTDDMARVITAVAQGDLSQRMELEIDSRPLQGTFLRTARTVNKMVDQLNSFASEVTRVAREVGTEGNLGGQADVKGVAGTWRDLTDSVNWMASNLTGQVRNIADVTTAVAKGDLTRKITVDARGEILELKNTINTMVDQLSSFASEVTRVATEVGTDGKLGGQADVRDVSGTWRDLTDSVNSMASNLTDQVRNIAEVTTSVATGDLSRKITVDARGEILELKNTINTMVDQLNSFASEVTRVAREVGTEGKLGGQAQVRGISGTWKDLTDNVNFMAANLTSQVRGIAKVVTAVANGDLKQKLTVEAKGEIAQLSDTINAMIDTLATFAEQVTTVAREVGVDGRLGGQANVPGAAGTWRDLTDNVNRLAANLTTQVRAIAEVATAVTKGDLTRSIQVEASGEVAILKDNVNQMIANLRETTRVNSEQDWLKTNLARFTRMLQGQRDLMSVARQILSELAPVVSAHQGVFYTLRTSENAEPRLRLLASYAYKERKQLSNEFALGEGLVGQCALEKERILLTNVPSDYIHISSGLGAAPPLNIVVLPIVFEGQVKGVLELASFERFSPTHLTFLEQLVESIGIVLNTIEATSRTEDLLKQSQSLAAELQSQQEELQQTNEELEEKARLLVDQNAEVERKNAEVERSRQALEEKAAQLALTSKYKSEFLSNMSHELRTPLNSLMILSQQLAENPDGNLTSRQVDFARTILSSGTDLLTLINDILDLSKVESGTVSLELGDLPFTELRDYVERSFRHIADSKGLEYVVDLAPSLPSSMYTDATRLQQILKNLLSNAFKFTDRGSVHLAIDTATSGWRADNTALNRSARVISFAVSDTGIGIPPEKQQLVFEAFQQADGTTSRKYGGTGLGLSISRELAKLLNGEIRLESVPGEGSIFTLYVPQNQTTEMAWPRGPFGDMPGSGGDEFFGGPAETDGGQRFQQPLPSTPEEPAAIARIARDEPAKDAAPVALVDDRNDIKPGDRVLLVVEDDPTFARVLLDLSRAQGFKGVVALRGDSALALVQRYRPDAITLDLRLPDLDGWRIMDRLKDN